MKKETSPLAAYLKPHGKLAELATALSVDRTTIWRWCNGRVPADRLREVEMVTGIPRSDLRPDIFEAAE